MAGHFMSLHEAAARIGISRRRAQDLIARGQLPARRLGNAWTVSAEAVHFANRVLHHEAGHPLSQRGACETISASLDGEYVPRDVRDLLRRRVRARAAHRFLFVAPGLLVRLRADARTVLSGRDAASVIAPVDPLDWVDAYVRASDYEALCIEYRMTEGFEGANVFAHVVDDDAWPFVPAERLVGAWVAWLDLADQGDRAEDTLLDRILGGREL